VVRYDEATRKEAKRILDEKRAAGWSEVWGGMALRKALKNQPWADKYAAGEIMEVISYTSSGNPESYRFILFEDREVHQTFLAENAGKVRRTQRHIVTEWNC
jgi:hypothetical protein